MGASLPGIVPCPVPPWPIAALPPHAGDGTRKRRTQSTLRIRKKQSIGPKTQRNRILLFGRWRELALYRAEVLRSQGFSVTTPDTKEEAVSIIRRGHFDIAILTYTLSSDTVQELAELIREYCADCPLIAISNSHREDREIRPDVTVLADDGPRALLAALRRVTRRN
jgi:hypothetical protein